MLPYSEEWQTYENQLQLQYHYDKQSRSRFN